jgi:hypothetical protein
MEGRLDQAADSVDEPPAQVQEIFGGLPKAMKTRDLGTAGGRFLPLATVTTLNLRQVNARLIILLPRVWQLPIVGQIKFLDASVTAFAFVYGIPASTHTFESES